MQKSWICALALIALLAACVKPESSDSDYAVQSRYGAWSVLCSEAQANCIAYLPVEDMAGKPILHISGEFLPKNKQAALAGFIIQIPARMIARGRPDLTVNKAAGLVISVDHRLARRYSIEDCKPDYCVVKAGVPREFLRALERGKTAKLTLVFSGWQERTEEFSVPLNGLAEAMKAAG